MNKVTVLRAANRRSQPWKNGGGVTREVMTWPPSAGLSEFAWRVSITEVVVAGPFLGFEGGDRRLSTQNCTITALIKNGARFLPKSALARCVSCATVPLSPQTSARSAAASYANVFARLTARLTCVKRDQICQYLSVKYIL